MKEWEQQKSKQNEDKRHKRSNEIVALSSKIRNDREIKTNNVLLINGGNVQNLWENSLLKALYNKGFSEQLF